jgi:hypothetical protein
MRVDVFLKAELAQPAAAALKRQSGAGGRAS